jgi:hypothetical protein
VTIILGGDSLYPQQSKQKTPKSTEDRRDAALRSRGCDILYENGPRNQELMMRLKSQ